MKTNIDTISEALERLKGFTYHAAGSQDSDDIKTLIAALSTIEADAKPQWESEDIDMSGVENHISYCWLKCAYIEDGRIHFDRESLAKIIIERDDAIRREILQKVAAEIKDYHDEITWDDYEEGYKDGTENALAVVDAAIVATDTTPAILGTEPAQEESR